MPSPNERPSVVALVDVLGELQPPRVTRKRLRLGDMPVQMHRAYVTPKTGRQEAAPIALLLAAPPAIAGVATLAPGALLELVVQARQAAVEMLAALCPWSHWQISEIKDWRSEAGQRPPNFGKKSLSHNS